MATSAESTEPEIRHSLIRVIESTEVEQMGLAAAARTAVSTFHKNSITRFWIHVDVDVVRTSEMPAVDSPQDGDLSFTELTGLLREVLRTSGAIGMDVTIYDPDRDDGGEAGVRLASCLIDVLS